MNRYELAKLNLTFNDVLLVPQYSPFKSRKDTNTISLFGTTLPVISANMDSITEDKMASWIGSHGGLGAIHRFCSIERNLELFKNSPSNTFISLGVKPEDMERAEALFDAGAKYFCLDIAHGHSDFAGKALRRYRGLFGNNAHIMAGNVATLEGTQYLKENGADSVKVGIGPGSVCSTRIKTGFGVPQLSAIASCSMAGVPIIADGGITSPGDIVKALAAGAELVMLGGMLSGSFFTPGKALVKPNGNIVKQFRGMASKEAADEHLGGLTPWKTAEGVQVEVNALSEQQSDAIIYDIIGGLRSALSYAGANSIKDLQEKASFIQITNAGRLESLPHK